MAADWTPGTLRSASRSLLIRRINFFWSPVSPQSALILSVSTCEASNPGETRPSASKLRSNSAAPTNNVAASATCIPTRSHCIGLLPDTWARLCAASEPAMPLRVACNAGTNPNKTVDSKAQAKAYITMRQSSAILPRALSLAQYLSGVISTVCVRFEKAAGDAGGWKQAKRSRPRNWSG